MTRKTLAGPSQPVHLTGQDSDFASPLEAMDGGPTWTVKRTTLASANISSTPGDLTTAPNTGKYAHADDILISTDTAMRLDVQMETSGNVLASVYMPANGTVQITMRDGLLADAAGKKLQLKASVSGNIRATCCWHEV